MTDKVKTFWERHWSWIVQLFALVFSAGVIYATVNEAIKNRPDRAEVGNTIDVKIQKHVIESKEVYVRIDQVPGLNENLQSLKSDNAELKKAIDEIKQLQYQLLMRKK